MATAHTDISARVTARMATLSGAFVDSPAIQAALRVVLDNTDAPKIARASGTLAGSGTTTIDTVAGLTLIDGTGSSTIATIKAWILRITNPAANQTLKMGNAAANGLTTLVDLASAALVVGGGVAHGSGAFAMGFNPAGFAAVAGTDIITLTNSGTASLDYELILIGA